MTSATRTTKTTRNGGRAAFPIIGVGASAGGLEAFRALLEHFPPHTGSALVLIQHLDPTHTSLLGNALAGSTGMPVVEATHGLRVEPDHVYVIPANKMMTLEKGTLRLQARGAGRKPPMAIDHFFGSLAADRAERAVGVVLSGTGSDATLGLKAIKAAKGTTFAQDPVTARYDGMPLAAIGAAVVDFVLPLDQMAAKLAGQQPPKLAGQQPPKLAGQRGDGPAEGPEALAGLEPIFQFLRGTTGVDFTQYKQTTVKRRIARRMVARKVKDLRGYLEILRNDETEQGLLYEDMFIHVTEFFRDPPSFAILKEKVFPEIMKGKTHGTPIRIWIAACASGEEAYSVAIALLEFLDDRAGQFPLQVFASDISEPAVQRARTGIYKAAAVRAIGKARLSRFFTKVDGGYRIDKAIRDRCVFVRHDLASDPPFSKLDLITCRNTLIYFEAELQKRLMPMFHYALRQPGFLMLGRSETIVGFANFFSPVDKTSKIFSRRAIEGRIALPFSPGKRPWTRNALAGPRAPAFAVDKQREVDQILLARFTPAGVIVDDELNILQFRGHTGPYLEPAPGHANLNLLRMARPELLTDLRLAVHSAKQEHLSARREGIRLRSDGQRRDVNIEVVPLPSGGAPTQQFLVLFESPPAARDAAPRRRSASGNGAHAGSKDTRPKETVDKQLRELGQELTATREFLQSVIDQQATTNEELQTVNEELLSSNEELQSTNEEMETAKEELQSTNEELTTVNDELQTRSQEAAQLGNDLGNLFVSVDIPILFLDKRLFIRRFTPCARSLLSLIPSDVGRPIHDIQLNIEVPELEHWLVKVIETGVLKEAEVRDRAGHWHRLQIRPYKSSDDAIDGVVLSLLDIDALRRGVVNARRARDYADAVVQAVMTPLLILDENLGVRSVNQAFRDLFHPSPHVEGDPLDTLAPGPWHTPEIRALIERAIGDPTSLKDREARFAAPGAGVRDLLLNARQIPAPAGGERLLLLAIEDVTERKRADVERVRVAGLEQEARIAAAAAAAKDVFLAVLSHELRTPLNSILLWAQALQSGKVNPARVSRGIDTIVRSARSQSMLINDLLDVSRIVSGKLQVTLARVALRPIVERALDDIRPQADIKGVRVELAIEPAVGEVDADADRLRQIVWNLASNAVKFTPAGGLVRIRVEREGDQARIEVSDTGVGITANFLPRVFDRFAQVDSSATRAQGGLGLGLAIVAHLVARHDGTIVATSPGVGRGATFTVRLPLLDAALAPPEAGKDAAAARREGAARAGQPMLEGIRVLLVDDDLSSRETVSETLLGRGACVEVASTVNEAIAKVDSQRPDVILCDVAMPGRDGYALVEELRSRGDASSSTPIAALTPATATEQNRALAAGFQMHLTKPIDADELVLAVHELAHGESPAPH